MSLGIAFGNIPPIEGPQPHPVPDVDVNCTHDGGVEWVWNIFHECVVNDVQYAGFFLGLLSIVCWLVVFLPQFYAAYKTGQMDEAISPIFLFLWLLGDVSNLTGSLLSNQLGTQNDEEIIGYGCGCISAIFYLVSRIPQLYKNYKRKSVEGVAIMMFILTVFGNLFYGFSIIMEDTSAVFLMRHFPWLVGSLGTLCFDTIMLAQFRLYRQRDEPINEDEVRGLLTPNVRSDDEGFYRPHTKADA